jgi:hypothetical protein
MTSKTIKVIFANPDINNRKKNVSLNCNDVTVQKYRQSWT